LENKNAPLVKGFTTDHGLVTDWDKVNNIVREFYTQHFKSTDGDSSQCNIIRKIEQNIDKPSLIEACSMVNHYSVIKQFKRSTLSYDLINPLRLKREGPSFISKIKHILINKTPKSWLIGRLILISK
jgi:hypothetical protein